MRRVAVSFAVAACCLLCRLRRRWRNPPKRATSTIAKTSSTRRMRKRSTIGTPATHTAWMDLSERHSKEKRVWPARTVRTVQTLAAVGRTTISTDRSGLATCATLTMSCRTPAPRRCPTRAAPLPRRGRYAAPGRGRDDGARCLEAVALREWMLFSPSTSDGLPSSPCAVGRSSCSESPFASLRQDAAFLGESGRPPCTSGRCSWASPWYSTSSCVSWSPSRLALSRVGERLSALRGRRGCRLRAFGPGPNSLVSSSWERDACPVTGCRSMRPPRPWASTRRLAPRGRRTGSLDDRLRRRESTLGVAVFLPLSRLG
jgi:hypothetical protein